jgi:hypothetical protein
MLRQWFRAPFFGRLAASTRQLVGLARDHSSTTLAAIAALLMAVALTVVGTLPESRGALLGTAPAAPKPKPTPPKVGELPERATATSTNSIF